MNYFDNPDSKHFSFESFATGMDIETFGVISFKGYEAISKPYDFEIMLVSSKNNIDFEDVLQSQAVFSIHRGANDDVLYNGIISEFDQLHEVNDVVFYRARLVPKLWWLSLTHHNQVFLNQSVPDFIDEALRDGGLETADIDIGALNGYDDIDYICQYDESHFNFVSRWLERQGIYYYFTQEADGEVLVLTDTKFSHYALKQGSDLFYNPASGLEGTHMAEAIGAFTCRQIQLPAEIILKDYNYEKPSLDITSRANVDLRGRGVSYIYGEFFATPEEGERLASIRAEELLCQKQEFFGESTVPYIMPGFTFNMHNHYRDDFNQEYLILEVTHEGNQSHLMSGGIAADAGITKNQAIYRNSFKAIPNEVQYRPERLTEKPKISGTIHAKIDSEVDGEYAQIDEQGRYRVKLPFDINDERMDGKGSAPIRMMQSYAGKNRGMQFPLVKGTEVLLTFIEGNPDRPVIAGAVSNPETAGPVNSDNLTESVIQTGGNNKIRMEDKLGSERVMIESPAANSWIRVGATNDPVTLLGESPQYVDIGDTYTEQFAVATDSTDAANPVISPLFGPVQIKDSSGNVVTSIDTSSAGTYTLKYENNDKTDDTANRTVKIIDPATRNDLLGTLTDGIRIQSAGGLSLETKSRYGEYYTGKPTLAAPGNTPSQTGDMMAKYGVGYAPKNLKVHNSQLSYCTTASNAGKTSDDSFTRAIAEGHVKVSSLDTFNTQEGNIYDFGGYWNYNLGNSFAEEHIHQAATLNNKFSYFWPDDDGTTDRDTTTAEGATQGAITGGGIAGAFVLYIGLAIAKAASAHQGSISGSTMLGLTATGIGVIGGVAAVGAGIGAFAESGADFQGNLGDVMGGPDSGAIKTWAGSVGSSFKKVDATTGAPPATLEQDRSPSKDSGAPMHTGTTWVTKQFGDAYNFNRGNDISIRIGNTEEHQHGNTYEYMYGGIHEETKFNGKGRMIHWEQGGGGVKQEATWHTLSGLLTSYEYKKDHWFSYEGNFVTIPTVKISTSMSTLQAEVSASVGALKIGVSASTGIEMDFKLVAGLFVNMELKRGGEVTFNEVTGKASFKSFGLKAQKAEALQAEKNDLLLEQVALNLKSGQLNLEDSALEATNKKLKVSAGALDISGL